MQKHVIPDISRGKYKWLSAFLWFTLHTKLIRNSWRYILCIFKTQICILISSTAHVRDRLRYGWGTALPSTSYSRRCLRAHVGGIVRTAAPTAVFSCSLVWIFFLNTHNLLSYLHRKFLSGLRSGCCLQWNTAVFGRPRDSDALVNSLERNLAALSLWFRKNGMKVNANKTQLIVLGTCQNLRLMPQIQVEFMGAMVVGSRTVKNLGVVFDQNMTFSAHVDDVVRRCTGLLCGLSHSSHSLPRDTLQTIVQALVVSTLRYCISVYGVCGITQMARLQKMFHFGARVISGRRKYDHISEVLKDLNWLTVGNMHQYHSLTLLKQILFAGQPESLYSSLVTRGDIHHRVTRQADRLDRPVIRTDSGRRRFLFSAATAYNALPQSLRDMGPRRFRPELREYLLTKQSGTEND